MSILELITKQLFAMKTRRGALRQELTMSAQRFQQQDLSYHKKLTAYSQIMSSLNELRTLLEQTKTVQQTTNRVDTSPAVSNVEKLMIKTYSDYEAHVRASSAIHEELDHLNNVVALLEKLKDWMSLMVSKMPNLCSDDTHFLMPTKWIADTNLDMFAYVEKPATSNVKAKRSRRVLNDSDDDDAAMDHQAKRACYQTVCCVTPNVMKLDFKVSGPCSDDGDVNWNTVVEVKNSIGSKGNAKAALPKHIIFEKECINNIRCDIEPVFGSGPKTGGFRTAPNPDYPYIGRARAISMCRIKIIPPLPPLIPLTSRS